ncbi:MAG: polyprenyl synthetase family protein [Bacteroidota bacterium]
MISFKEAQDIIIKEIATLNIAGTPMQLYEPIAYILNSIGKRIRPAMVLMTAGMFSDNVKKITDLALAFEIFHNFTLVHDDLMDNAKIRRGNPTVHERWNNNTAILSGDAMLIMAYQFLQKADIFNYDEVFRLFNQTATEVCEGQMFDMKFEERMDISEKEYIEMIRLKTSVLIGACLQGGALATGADTEIARQLYEAGINLGLAFQLRDDYLDTYGDPEKFGKTTGGDIVENKKTLLFVKAMEIAGNKERESLLHYFGTRGIDSVEKIRVVTEIYNSLGIPGLLQDKISDYTGKAFSFLENLNVPDPKKQGLRELMEYLLTRES